MRHILLTLLCCALSTFAWAGDDDFSTHPYLDSTHTFSIGATRQKANIALRSSVPELPEIEVDFSKLGVSDDDTSWLLAYQWRFAENWVLTASAYAFDTGGTATARKSFNYDGVEFEAGARIKTELDIDTYIVDVMYSLYSSDKAEVLVGGGLHMFDLSAKMTGTVFVGSGEVSSSGSTDSILAPLPNLRAKAFYAFTPKWGAEASVGWLSANYEEYEGDFVYFSTSLVYDVSSRFTTSLGYQYTDINVTHEQSRRREREFEIGFDGVTLMLSYHL